jgi:hypothetical protein
MSALRKPSDEIAADRPWALRNREALESGFAWLRTALADHFAGAAEAIAAPPLGPAPRSAAAAAARAEYEARRAKLREEAEPAAIDRLSRLFGLTPFDEDCLLLAAAPRLDLGFAALFPNAAAPSPQLALALLVGGDCQALHLGFARFSPQAPLRRFRLAELDERIPSLLAPLDCDERIARLLAGEDYPDPRVRLWLRPVAEAPCPERHHARLAALAGDLRAAMRPIAVICGTPGSGRTAAAQATAASLGLGLAELRLPLLPEPGPARQGALQLLAREAALGGYAMLVDADEPASRDEAALLVHELAAPLFVTARERLDIDAPQLPLAPLGSGDRAILWRRALGEDARLGDGAHERLAEQFPLGPGVIAAIARANPAADEKSLWAACRETAGRGLDALAERVEPRFGWDDIVLPPAIAAELHALAAQVRHRATVYGYGGFGRKLVRGRGVTALFAGPSGAGKTMAAEIVAHELALDLCRVDLSGVVSKYIGETERNLRRVFDAAEGGGAVLFFDEADALFGKRSEVKDSHDRYANIEISYLLQRMESYSGLAILATNMKTHLDPAFLRRLRFVIDFPFPDAEQRRAIWERAFPSETRTEGLDFAALARLDVAGGNIAVIAVNAAFLAAAEESPVRMVHIARAARAEFRKLDKEYRPFWSEAS